MAKWNNIHRVIIILAGCLYACIPSARSQDATIKAVLKQPQLLMGDQTELVVQTRTTIDKPIVQWFNLPDTFNHLEILHRSPIDSSLEGMTKIYNQTFTITGFDSGVWTIPPLLVHVASKKISSTPLELTIVPAKLAGTEYNDIRDIIDVPEQGTPWWHWALIALAVIVAAAFAWWWIKRKKIKPAPASVRKSSLPLLEKALQRLNQLKAQNLPGKGEWKKYYSELTDIFKTYNEGKFRDGALQKTTDELLMSADQHLPKELLSELAETLRIADAVKFAKYEPEIARSATDIDCIEKNIKKLDNTGNAMANVRSGSREP